MSHWSTLFKHAPPNVMSDDQTNGGVRRFGRRDRKRSLDPRGPLFPPEDLTEETNPPAEENEPEPSLEADVFELPEPPAEVINTPVIQEPISTPRAAPKRAQRV